MQVGDPAPRRLSARRVLSVTVNAKTKTKQSKRYREVSK